MSWTFWSPPGVTPRPPPGSSQSVDEGDDRVRATYGANYDRLAQIKRRYDPTNLFRSNRNVPPLAEGSAMPIGTPTSTA